MIAALLTEQQVVEQFGLPKTRTVRTMRQQGLPAVKLGKAYLYDPSDVQKFIAQRKVTQCPGRTEVPISNSSNSAGPSTFTGASTAQHASDQQALRTVEKLKKLSQRSSKIAEVQNGLGRVIQASFPSPRR